MRGICFVTFVVMGFGAWTAFAGTTTIFVDADNASGTEDGESWGTAFTTISAAIAQAGPGDAIWIAEGAYDGGITLPASVALFGGFEGMEASENERDPELFSTTIVGQGGRVVTGGDQARLDGFRITNGSATDGAGLFCDGITMTVANCSFAFNVATSDGGAAFVGNSSDVAFENCEFMTNSAGSGGGVRIDNSAFSFSGCVFVGNTSTAEGGAISTDTMATGQISDCAFIQNDAVIGGGISIEDGEVNVTGCMFTKNSADNGGGGMLAVMAISEITDCTFTGNAATNGGGIGASDSDVTVLESSLTGNIAQEGGGFYSEGGTISIQSSTVESNLATGQSGGLHFETPTNAQLKDAIVRANTSLTSAAGGVNVVGGLFVAERTKFMDNTAETSGGGLFTSMLGQTILVNTLFVRNAADQGGAISFSGGENEVVNSTFTRNAGNIGASAIWNGNGSSLTGLNLILWGNYGPADIANAGMLDVDFSNVEAAVSGLSNLSQDPEFFDPANDDYRLMATSPSVDSGVQQKGASLTPTDDLRRAQRPQGAGIDMGAYEHIPDEDADGDGLPDAQESTDDTDGDGLPNYLDADSDDDGLNDGFEQDGGLNPLDAADGADVDSDNDGLSNATEQSAGTDPTDIDSDGDGVIDPIEIAFRTDPNDDQDGPQLANDDDNDGLPNILEPLVGGQSGNPDSDGDNIDDGFEVIYGLQPFNPNDAGEDADSDGLTNEEEINTYRTDPNEPDTDGDGVNDGDEVDNGTDPLMDRMVGDVNNDGVVNAVDVQLTINSALGVL